MSNYPDNIRDFDNHPHSPFYVPKSVECPFCTKHFPEDEGHTEDHKHNFCSEDCHDDYYRNDCCGEVECICP